MNQLSDSTSGLLGRPQSHDRSSSTRVDQWTPMTTEPPFVTDAHSSIVGFVQQGSPHPIMHRAWHRRCAFHVTRPNQGLLYRGVLPYISAVISPPHLQLRRARQRFRSPSSEACITCVFPCWSIGITVSLSSLAEF